MRGSRPRLWRRRQNVGSIPACAGQPGRSSGYERRTGVDPRVCGAASTNGLRANTNPGRSPRVRGSQSAQANERSLVGSIPACAGQPRRNQAAPRRLKVDPRVCGAAALGCANAERRAGRSPRVRGSRLLPEPAWSARGSIPACAGQPCERCSESQTPRVDPRVCGAASTTTGRSGGIWGRSPRVRGSPRETRRADRGCGSIPACAGQPIAIERIRSAVWVDPRVCGAARALTIEQVTDGGRSPRVRGSRRCVALGRGARGSIPACAGQPSRSKSSSRSLGVDPRVCGAAKGPLKSAELHEGRSPRVRGSQNDQWSRVRSYGSIPACAGQPRDW